MTESDRKYPSSRSARSLSVARDGSANRSCSFPYSRTHVGVDTVLKVVDQVEEQHRVLVLPPHFEEPFDRIPPREQPGTLLAGQMPALPQEAVDDRRAILHPVPEDEVIDDHERRPVVECVSLLRRRICQRCPQRALEPWLLRETDQLPLELSRGLNKVSKIGFHHRANLADRRRFGAPVPAG